MVPELTFLLPYLMVNEVISVKPVCLQGKIIFKMLGNC